jgi:glycosyltransferase involved in cell wall biosynthesis
MKISISVGGKFHAFYLAEQLQKKNFLTQLITSYPSFEVTKSGINSTFITSLVLKELLQRGYGKLPQIIQRKYNPQYLISDIYDKNASRHLRSCDLFVGWSGFSLHTLDKAKEFGAVTLIERGSSHIEFQRDILKEEYEAYNVTAKVPHPKLVEKELLEYNAADYISVPSLYVKKTFLEKGFPEKKILQVPYGVDLSQFKQLPKEDNIFRIIHCGAVSLRKGCHYLLQAFHELNIPDAELWFVGEVVDEILPFVNRYQSDQIKFLGHQPQSKLSYFYSQANAFVLFSLEEGLAMVQAQAMACGLPVICTTNTGGEDLIEDGKNGFVLPVRDVAVLKEKIMFFYENQDICGEMGAAAQNHVNDCFTWDFYGERIIENYAHCLKMQKQ